MSVCMGVCICAWFGICACANHAAVAIAVAAGTTAAVPPPKAAEASYAAATAVAAAAVASPPSPKAPASAPICVVSRVVTAAAAAAAAAAFAAATRCWVGGRMVDGASLTMSFSTFRYFWRSVLLQRKLGGGRRFPRPITAAFYDHGTRILASVAKDTTDIKRAASSKRKYSLHHL
eukprot:scaffold94088_cov59-Phaeocystis_antarctica.AAC.2